MPAPKKRKRTLGDVINQLVEETNSDMRRLRVLEQNAEILGNRINSIEQNVLGKDKQMKSSISDLQSKINGLDRRLTQIEATMKEIVKQIKLTATKSDLSGLEELIELYNPIKSKFMTREEVERLIEENRE